MECTNFTWVCALSKNPPGARTHLRALRSHVPVIISRDRFLLAKSPQKSNSTPVIDMHHKMFLHLKVILAILIN